MWCPRCHTEVAAEIAQNGQSLLCTSCGTEIQRIYAPSLHPDTRSARELLERWSKADPLDVASGMQAEVPALTAPGLTPLVAIPLAASTESPGPLGTSPPSQLLAQEEISVPDEPTSDTTSRRDRPERAKPERPTPKPRTTWRVDAAHSVTQPSAPLPPPVPPRRPHFSAVAADVAAPPSPQAPPPVESPPAAAIRTPEPVSGRAEFARHDASHGANASEPAAPRAVASASVFQRRLDQAHASLGGPHFDLQSFLDQDSRQPGKSESIWGQVLAYAGVGLITVGTTLVLWSWFGKVPHYAPTGWLVCTIGQMLLFLGVTTLISGGMQQTSHDVTRRVEYLGDRILRFESTADQLLRGPHFQESRDRAKSKAGQGSPADDGQLDA